MHYYKKNIGDYAKKTGRLTMLQHGAYTLLIDACYDREQFPTLEEAIEWTWALDEAEIAAVQFVLQRFFTLQEGRYIQSRIAEELAEYQGKALKNKEIAVEREAKRKAAAQEQSTQRAPVVHETPPNHKPITNNHKPLLKTLPKAAPSVDPVFEELWQHYPKRPGASKADTLKAYKARIAKGVEAALMLKGAKDYANYCKVAGIDPQYIKQPATFFGPNEHFLSDWTPPANSGQAKELPLATDAQIEHAYRVECGGDPTQARFGSYMEMRKFIVDRREKRRVGV